jgi:predicted TIM-barrel fold metal-dependent hydrolase
MHDMWREAAKNQQSICCLADPDALSSIESLCKLHPETPVVIDHFARIGMRGEVDQKQLDQLLKLSDFKHTAVKTSAFYALGKKTPPYDDLGPMIRQLRDAYGANRLMWASDCPFQTEGKHSYKSSIALIRDRLDFLSEAEKTAMLRGTAERLFF